MFDFIIQYKEIIEIIIQLLVAIGTCGAVISSLYLANKQNKLKVRACVSIMKIPMGENSFLVKSDRVSGIEYMVFSIQNLGARPAIIKTTSFYFEFKSKDKIRIWVLPLDKDSVKYPITMNQGESNPFVLKTYEEFLTRIATDVENDKNIYNIKAFYDSGTGEKIYAKIDQDTRKRIIKDAEILRQQLKSNNVN